MSSSLWNKKSKPFFNNTSTFSMTNNNNDGYGVRCIRASRFNLNTNNTQWCSAKQTTLTKANVVLDRGSIANFSSALEDNTVGNMNLLIVGNLAAVAGPGPYSTSANDYALGPTQNCNVTFG